MRRSTSIITYAREEALAVVPNADLVLRPAPEDVAQERPTARLDHPRAWPPDVRQSRGEGLPVVQPPRPGSMQYSKRNRGGLCRYAASVWTGNAPMPYREDSVLVFALCFG